MKIWKTILVDDEPLARQRLRRLLQPFDQIEITGEADNGQSGLEQIAALAPDLVFLDIEMPVMNGFEMLERIQEPPKVVFTTAYDQYAIQAFEQNSVDYLLKPIEKERLDKTIARLDTMRPNNDLAGLQEIIRQVQQKPAARTITIKTGDRIILLKTEDISYAQAEEKYVYLFTTDGRKHLTDYTLSNLEERLPTSFVRIHRACIINADQIREIRRGFNGVFNFVLHNHEKTPVSSSRSNSEEIRLRFDL